jgi:hypothetical protein
MGPDDLDKLSFAPALCHMLVNGNVREIAEPALMVRGNHNLVRCGRAANEVRALDGRAGRGPGN